MNAKLLQAVKKQLKDSSYFRDIANHGIMGGFPGFTYYAEEFGQTPIQFVQSFNCLNKAYNDAEGEAEIARALYGRLESDDIQIPNALAWFAAEEAAREYIETGMERDETEEE